MAVVIKGPCATSTHEERKRLCDRYLGRWGVRCVIEPDADGDLSPKFVQRILKPMILGDLKLLLRVDEHVSWWRDGVRVFDVLRLRKDYRRERERIRAKVERALEPARRAKKRHEDWKESELVPFCGWVEQERYSGRYQILNPWGGR